MCARQTQNFNLWHFSKKYGDATTPDKKVNIDEAASQLVTCSVRQQELIVLPYGSC